METWVQIEVQVDHEDTLSSELKLNSIPHPYNYRTVKTIDELNSCCSVEVSQEADQQQHTEERGTQKWVRLEEPGNMDCIEWEGKNIYNTSEGKC